MSLSSSSNSSMEGLGMEAPPVHDEAMAAAYNDNNNNNSSNSSSSNTNNVAVKGKRTKRQRLHPSLTGPASSTTTSSADLSGSATEEEEDMANCLILLARGRALDTAELKPEARAEEQGAGGEKFSSRRFAEATTTTNGKAGFYVYECKTCNKCFPSFQALGGHRASHKKTKTAATTITAVEDKKEIEEDTLQISMATFAKPIVTPIINNNNNNNNYIGSNKSRVHECSICGSEFSSGQALGGHMRRHRSITTASPGSPQEVKKEKNLLSLDLNLPAPTDDERCDLQKSAAPVSAFPFASKQQPLLFTASALVDCHY